METSSVILTLIGGSLIVVGGIMFFVWSLPWMHMSTTMMDGMMMGDMMHGMGWTMNNHFWQNIVTGLSVSSIVSGAIVIVSGLMIYTRRHDSHIWAVVALVFSVFGFLGMGGFIVGSMLGILGGILALFKRQGI